MVRDRVMRPFSAAAHRLGWQLKKNRLFPMHRALPYVTLFVGVILGLTTIAIRLWRTPVAHAQAPPACPGPQAPGAIWPLNKQLTLYFNDQLDSILETNVGNANSRWMQSFMTAVSNWQTVLNNLGGPGQTPVTLTPMRDMANPRTKWGIDQGMALVCTETDPKTMVKTPVWMWTAHNPTPDGFNSTSTGYNPPSSTTWIRMEECWIQDG